MTVKTTFVVVGSVTGLTSSATALLAERGYVAAGTYTSRAHISVDARVRPKLTFICAGTGRDLAEWVQLSSCLWPGSKIIGLLDSEARDIGLLDPERRIVACLGMPITDEILIQVVDLVAQGHSRIFLFPQASRSPSPAGHAEHASMPPKPQTLPVNGATRDCNPVRVLSRRERELLDGVASGHSNKRIALDFGLSEATVKVHLKSIFRKLGVSNRTQAAMFFLGLMAIAPLNHTAQSVFKHSSPIHRTRASSVGDASATSLRPRNE